MPRASVLIVVLLGLGLGACNRDSRSSGQSAAHEAGREAYDLTQKTKKAAKELGHDLREAGKEAHQGWNEAKRDAQTKSRK